MILGRFAGCTKGDTPSGGLHVIEESSLILSEQARSITEPRIADKVMWAWMASVPTQDVADRIEADRRSVDRQMAVAFA